MTKSVFVPVFSCERAVILAGQRMMVGTRIPPSKMLPLEPNKPPLASSSSRLLPLGPPLSD